MNNLNALAVQAVDRLYLLVLNDPSTINQPALERYITDARTIVSWACPLPTLYMLRSPIEGQPLRIALAEILGQQTLFCVSEANPGNIDGVLQNEAWQWLWNNFEDFRKKVFGIRDRLVEAQLSGQR